MIKIFETTIKKILQDAGVAGEIELMIPPNPEMGDRAYACFGLAKEQKKNPAEVAQNLVATIVQNQTEHYELFEAIVSAGPYVNFYFKTSKLAQYVIEKIEQQGEDFGANVSGQGKKVMIEYPSQNTHKEFHIGHLRNVCIGNTLVKLYEKNGYQVVPVNYINDFGSHVVKCLWGIQKFYNGKIPKENKQKWLGEVYAEASNFIKDHTEVQSELDELQKKLESRDTEVWELFEKTRAWSLEGFEKIHKELDVKHTKIFYESEVKDKGQTKVDELLQNGLAKIGEKGAVIIDLSNFGLDIALVRKATGAGLYLTSDLALAEKKFQNTDIEESITITGIEQNFYFKQLFKVLELSGFKNKMTHIGYGLVNLPEGKMSSRSGNVILYEDLRNKAYEQLLEESKKRHPEWGEEKLHEIVEVLTMGVLKFTMQKHEAHKNIVFDIKEAVSFEGFSAPYILYVVARINSLIRKSQVESLKLKVDYELFQEKEEKKMLLLLAEYPQIVKKALENYNPSVITKYCFDLSQAFNEFYNQHQILGESADLMMARLVLSETVKEVLINALSILSIKTIEEM